MIIQTVDVKDSASAISDVRALSLSIAARVAKERAAVAEELARKRDRAINYWNQSDLWCAKYHMAIVAKMDNEPEKHDIHLSKPCEYYMQRWREQSGVKFCTATSPRRSRDESISIAHDKRRGKVTMPVVSDSYLYKTDEHFTR